MTLAKLTKATVLVLALVLAVASIQVAADDVILPAERRMHHHQGMARRYSSRDSHSSSSSGEHSSTSTSSSSPAAKSAWASGSSWYLQVKTHEGKVKGRYNATSGVYSWLGVPYGADTGGENRWKPPRPAPSWTNVRDATKYAPSCPQHGSDVSVKAVGLFGLSPEVFDQDKQSEDCLTADIWVGKNHWERFVESNGTAKKAPVWLNIYGGSYEWGSSRIELYKGDGLVSQDDIVVVSVNFRNWIFGFPLAPQFDISRNRGNSDYKGANPGLNDVDFAIEWVYKNIERFGGDPEKITMGGTSTGACTVDNWAYLHYNKPTASRIKGLILQSGSMTSLGRYFVAEDGTDFSNKTADWNRVAKEVGCGTAGDAKQLSCMRSKHWKDIMGATFATNSKFFLAIDNTTVFNNYYERLEQKRYVDIPMLIGNNKDEGNAFLIHDAWSTDVAGPIVTAEVWVCPASVQAKERQGVAPTWRYRWSPSFYLPDTPLVYHELLSFHGSDTAYAWNSWEPLKYIGNQSTGDPGPLVYYPFATDDFDTRRRIADVYRAANVRFVQDPEHGLYNFRGGWPTYSPDKPSIGDIGYKNEVKFRLIPSSDVDGLCQLTNSQVDKANMKWKPAVQRVSDVLV